MLYLYRRRKAGFLTLPPQKKKKEDGDGLLKQPILHAQISVLQFLQPCVEVTFCCQAVAAEGGCDELADVGRLTCYLLSLFAGVGEVHHFLLGDADGSHIATVLVSHSGRHICEPSPEVMDALHHVPHLLGEAEHQVVADGHRTDDGIFVGGLGAPHDAVPEGDAERMRRIAGSLHRARKADRAKGNQRVKTRQEREAPAAILDRASGVFVGITAQRNKLF